MKQTVLALVFAMTAMSMPAAEAQRVGGLGNDPNLADVNGLRPAPSTFANDLGDIYEDAVMYVQKAQWREAETALDQVLARQQNVAMPNYLMGRAKIGLENMPDALKYMRTAVKLDPNFYEARGYLGALELRARNVDAVKEQLLFLDKAQKDCKASCAKKAAIDDAIALIMVQTQKKPAAG